MTIAVDFDGTLVENKYPGIGKAVPFAIEVCKKLQEGGEHQLILWTVREGKLLQDAVNYCESKGLKFYAVNKNYPEENELIPRKLAVDLFIDDRNLGGLPDWGVIYKIIKAGDTSLYNFEEILWGDERKPQRKKNIFLRIGEALDRSRGNAY